MVTFKQIAKRCTIKKKSFILLKKNTEHDPKLRGFCIFGVLWAQNN